MLDEDEAAEPVQTILDPIHEQHRVANHSGLSPAEFLVHICNKCVVLPEKGLTPSMHMPIGSASGRGEISLGWRSGQDVLLVLPNVSGLETVMKEALPRSNVPAAAFLRQELQAAGVPLEKALVTYAVRFPKPNGDGAYKQSHKSSNAILVREDIRQCRPKVIVTFGADAYKALFGTKAKLDTERGNVLSYEGIPVIPTVSHQGFMAGYGDIDVFRAELRRAALVINDSYTVETVDQSGYSVVTTPEEVTALCNRIRAEYDSHLAFDFEFGNDLARGEFSYPLSLQLGWAKGKAAFIQLRKEGGAILHSEAGMKSICNDLYNLMSDRKYQLVGQHIRVDIDVANKLGINIDTRILDGFDTMLAHHALYGDSSQGLDHLCRKYTPEFGAYWADLENWLDKSPNGRKSTLRFGYRDIPFKILIPYGLKDADVTWRVAKILKEELATRPAISGYFYNIAMPAALHLLDVQRQGIRVDEARRASLLETYKPVYQQLLAKFRERINWPDFNPGSKHNVAAFLFSTTQYKDKKAAPKDAKLLTLTPLCNTDKYPKPWGKIVEADEELRNTPSTKSNIIEILFKTHKLEELKWLKQLSVIGKFLSTYLSPVVLNEFGVPTDGKGFANNIWADGRVRTNLSQVSETGRLRSSAANLQTNPKKQEEAALATMVDFKFGLSLKDYMARCKSDGPDRIPFEERLVLPSFKSCYIPDDGNELLEADFKTAEICVWAFCSGDPALIRVIDQDRDVHSEVAAVNFQLPEAKELPGLLAQLDSGDPVGYKVWVEKFKKKHGALRVCAKALIFGIMYGRSAGAIARALSEQGVNTDLAKCQAIIDDIAKRFPVAWKFIKSNQAFAVANEYLPTSFGNARYFSGASQLSEKEQAAVMREAANSFIQSSVAMLALRAGANLYRYRYQTEIGKKVGFKVLLPIHDAFLIEYPKCYRKEMDAIITIAMSTSNKIAGTTRHLGIDIEHFDRWGEH